MNFDRHNYEISEHFASALINGDYTGLNDEDEKTLQAFTDNAYNAHGLGFWDMDPAEQPELTRCEVTDLLANCFEFTYCTVRK